MGPIGDGCASEECAKAQGRVVCRRFLHCGGEWRREASGPEHASDLRKARGGHVRGILERCVRGQRVFSRSAIQTRGEAFSRRWRTCSGRSVVGRSRQALPGRREVWGVIQRCDRRRGPAEGDAGRGRPRPGERCRSGNRWRPPESVSDPLPGGSGQNDGDVLRAVRGRCRVGPALPCRRGRET